MLGVPKAIYTTTQSEMANVNVVERQKKINRWSMPKGYRLTQWIISSFDDYSIICIHFNWIDVIFFIIIKVQLLSKGRSTIVIYELSINDNGIFYKILNRVEYSQVVPLGFKWKR